MTYSELLSKAADASAKKQAYAIESALRQAFFDGVLFQLRNGDADLTPPPAQEPTP